MSTLNYHHRHRGVSALQVIIVLVVISTLALAIYQSQAKKSQNLNLNQPVYQVKRGPLRISITESGTIKARDMTILKSKVEARTTILYIIPEGTYVKKGELLVELDSATLVNDHRERTIRYQNANANFINAQENLEIIKSQALSDIDTAELNLKFAKDDLNKYIEGEFPKLKTEAEARIKLAEEELGRADETYTNAQKLYEEKYISRTELKNEEISRNRKQLDLDLARNNLQLLIDFDYKRKLEQLQSDVKQAQMELERTKRKSNANIIQAEAKLAASKSEKLQEEEKLKQLEEQITNTKIIAPHDGQVIYASSARRDFFRGSDEPLKIGIQVHERQDLIYLPVSQAVKAEIDIHETSLKKVRVNLPVIIQVDALPNSSYMGTLTRIAPLPDPQSMWMNPDLKVYNADINIDQADPALRTGMSCKAEIIVEQYDDAIAVPLQAVIRIKNKPFVYVKTPSGFEPRPVELGLDNNRLIRITSGLEEGEQVSLTPPLYQGEKSEEDRPFLNAIKGSANHGISDDIRQKLNNLPPADKTPNPSQANPASRPQSQKRGSGQPGQPGQLGRPGQTGPAGSSGRGRNSGQTTSGRQRPAALNSNPKQ